jgi:hypothetical protein
MDSIKNWLSEQEHPVVLVHHEPVTLMNSMPSRRLDATNSTWMPLTEEDISSYQVLLYHFYIFFLMFSY